MKPTLCGARARPSSPDRRTSALATIGPLVGALLLLSCRPPVSPSPVAPDATTAAGRNAPPSAPAAPSGNALSRRSSSANASANSAPPSTASSRRVVASVAPPMPREFRGVWVASVANMDWPSSRRLTTAQQQAELIALLDRAAALKLNAVLFQVRPAADALYASKIEPWSEYLTGAQGRAPDPYWDPLEFAVREAHARNLELHAWFNPYRARFSDAHSPLAASHIARTNPSLVKTYAGYLWMDPGEPAVRERTVRVVLDVVKRYDIDGVHLDDYFYPYPEVTKRRRRPIPFPDDKSWLRYRKSGGTLTRGDWRRANVDSLVRALDVGVHRTKPWVKFGISPFGIWRPGFPAQVRGFDAYSEIYADGRKWLREGWVDYFTPQLYWPTTKAQQAYPVLLDWWVGENVKGRHLWPGNYTSRAGGSARSDFPVSELLEQIRVTRAQPGSTGNVHFSMQSFLVNQANMNDSLQGGPYASVALVPATQWLSAAAPATPAPQLSSPTRSGVRSLALRTVDGVAPWQWLVRLRTDTAWISVILPGTTASWPLPEGTTPTIVSVSALNRIGVESATVNAAPAALRTSSPAPAKRGREHEH